MKLESRPFNVRNCVEEALDLFAAEIRIKGLEAVYLVASDVPSHLIGDSMRLRQILVNLIGNAMDRPAISARIMRGASMSEWLLSRRDSTIVARHEVPGMMRK